VPKGQSEAGWAFGMSRFYTFRKMVLPQMVRFALPSFTNNWLVLLKSTALVSVIGLTDITNLAKQAGAAARGEIFGMFPELASRPGEELFHAARRDLRRAEAGLVLA